MPGDDIYWSLVEQNTDESHQDKEPYVDPWDLENYAYIREHLDSMELSSTASVPNGGSGEFVETPSHSFDYVPGKRRTGTICIPPVKEKSGYDSLLSEQGNYVAIDEVEQYDRKTRSETQWPSRRNIIEGYKSDADEMGLYSEQSVFGIYDEKGVFRRVAVPLLYAKTSRDRSFSYSYGDYKKDSNLNSRSQIYSRLKDGSLRRDPNSPIYDDIKNKHKQTNFSLNKSGHLKIDYSCSWNNLNNYIKYNY